jgi:hypothetical protein
MATYPLPEGGRAYSGGRNFIAIRTYTGLLEKLSAD